MQLCKKAHICLCRALHLRGAPFACCLSFPLVSPPQALLQNPAVQHTELVTRLEPYDALDPSALHPPGEDSPAQAEFIAAACQRIAMVRRTAIEQLLRTLRPHHMPEAWRTSRAWECWRPRIRNITPNPWWPSRMGGREAPVSRLHVAPSDPWVGLTVTRRPFAAASASGAVTHKPRPSVLFMRCCREFIDPGPSTPRASLTVPHHSSAPPPAHVGGGHGRRHGDGAHQVRAAPHAARDRVSCRLHATCLRRGVATARPLHNALCSI